MSEIDMMSRCVDGDITIDAYLFVLDIFFSLGEGIDSYEEFSEFKWLGKIIITSEREHLELVLEHGVRRKYDDWCLDSLLPDHLYELSPVHDGHIDIEYDDIIVRATYLLERF